MKKGDLIDDNHHVIRFVDGKRCIRDEDEIPYAFYPEAFKPRASDNNALSVDWVEFYDSDHVTNITKAVKFFRTKLTRDFTNSAFGIGSVSKIKEVALENESKIRITFDGHKHNPPHTLMRPIDPEDQSLLEALADDVFDLILESSIPK